MSNMNAILNIVAISIIGIIISSSIGGGEFARVRF